MRQSKQTMIISIHENFCKLFIYHLILWKCEMFCLSQLCMYTDLSCPLPTQLSLMACQHSWFTVWWVPQHAMQCVYTALSCHVSILAPFHATEHQSPACLVPSMCLNTYPLSCAYTIVSDHVSSQPSLFVCLNRWPWPNVCTAVPVRVSKQVALTKCLHSCTWPCFYSDIPGHVSTQPSPTLCLHSCTLVCHNTDVLLRVATQNSLATCLYSCPWMCPLWCPWQRVLTVILWHVPILLFPGMCVHSFTLAWA
jgi:hypothetical protein